MSSPEDKTRKIFGARVAQYSSTRYAENNSAIIEKMRRLAQPQPTWNILDVATGGGHTALAFAPHVTRVIGVDLTPEMLKEAKHLQREKGLPNVEFQISDVHHLPFPAKYFDLVLCRRAAHHFSNIKAAISEVWRVLRPNGIFVVEDLTVPENDFLDQCMDELERLHDESHVREYRPSEWRRLLSDENFKVEDLETYTVNRALGHFGVSQSNAQKMVQIIRELTADQRKLMNVQEINGDVYTDRWFIVFTARKTDKI